MIRRFYEKLSMSFPLRTVSRILISTMSTELSRNVEAVDRVSASFDEAYPMRIHGSHPDICRFSDSKNKGCGKIAHSI